MRLIDADALKAAFGDADADVCESYRDGYCDWGFGRKNVNDIIAGIPTVDAVPVVRCRECEHWKPYGSKGARKLGDPLERYGGCEICSGGHLESDFCSYGKRKEEQNGRT